MAPSVSILTGFDCISNIESTVKAMTFLNPFLDQATQKNTRQIILPKYIPESKILNPKNCCAHPCHLNPRVAPLGMNVE